MAIVERPLAIEMVRVLTNSVAAIHLPPETPLKAEVVIHSIAVIGAEAAHSVEVEAAHSTVVAQEVLAVHSMVEVEREAHLIVEA